MAKMKTWAVEVEITTKRTQFVDARKAGGAAEKVLTEEGWREATRYDPDGEDAGYYLDRRNAKVVGVREAGF